jgi:hypothetical protein
VVQGVDILLLPGDQIFQGGLEAAAGLPFDHDHLGDPVHQEDLLETI